MKLFMQYLRQKWRVLAAFTLFAAVLAVCFALYRLPLRAVWYPLALCAALGLSLLTADFLHLRRRHETLCRLRAAPDPAQLPSPAGICEEDYQALVRALDERARRAETDARMRAMIDYYTLWAHQIKTPISAMRLMLGEEDTPRSRALSAELFRIDRYAEMALNYARLNSTSNDLVFAKVEVEPVIKRVVRQYAGQFVRKHIALKCDIAPVQVLTDEKWLAFILGQLLANAVKYTESGTVTVTVTKNKVLKVSDTGIGIAPEDLPRIFEKGFTGYNGRAEKKSTGLGMYLSRRAADMLGHTLSVQSAPGAGSTFSLDMKESNLQVE